MVKSSLLLRDLRCMGPSSEITGSPCINCQLGCRVHGHVPLSDWSLSPSVVSLLRCIMTAASAAIVILGDIQESARHTKHTNSCELIAAKRQLG